MLKKHKSMSTPTLDDHAKYSKNQCAQIQQRDHLRFQYKPFLVKKWRGVVRGLMKGMAYYTLEFK